MRGTLREIYSGESKIFAAWEAAERPYPWSASQFQVEVGSKRRVFVWEEEGRPRAFAVLQLVGDEAYLQNFMVDPAHRRRGLGSTLLQKVIILSREHGARTVVLDVDAANRPAVSLYLKSGFSTVERRRGSYPRGEDALLMKKDL
jgi:ribosomal-protein-alanine N-acetyltransferase